MVAPNIPIRMLENPTESAIPVTAPVHKYFAFSPIATAIDPSAKPVANPLSVE